MSETQAGGTRFPSAHGQRRTALFAPHHTDQAEELRRLAAQRREAGGERPVTGNTRVIAVTSGKGGVGKTSLVVNLAVTLARWGQRVIILDCDLGTANVDVMLGMHPRYNLQHVLSRQRRLDEVMSVGPHGIRIISGGSGLQEMANLTDGRREELLETFAALEGQADFLFLDTGAGISANVLRFVVAAGEALVVTTPEPTAVTDAYALIKVLSQQARLYGGVTRLAAAQDAAAESVGTDDRLRVRLVVNQATSEAEARETATNVIAVAKRFLDVDVEPLASIPTDRHLTQAIRQQTALVERYPQAGAAQAIGRLAARLLEETREPLGSPSPPHDRRTPAPLPTRRGEAMPEDAHSISIIRSENETCERSMPAGTALPGRPRPAPQVNPSSALRGIGMFVQRLFGDGHGRVAKP